MKNQIIRTLKISLAFLLAVVSFSGCGAQSKLTKYLRNDLNDSAARYWADFIEQNGINAIDEDGDTLLYYAIQNYKDPKLVDLCLKAKADFSLVPRGKKDLIVVAFRMEDEAIWDVLFKNGVPVRSDEEGRKYDLLYSCFKSPYMTQYEKFFLNYYTEKDLDYRGYAKLDFLDWRDPQGNEVFFEMDKKGYKPHIANLREFISDYVNQKDEPSLKEVQFECLKKYISDEWYKTENSYIVDLDNLVHVEPENENRVFKAMDFVFKCGYEFEDAYLADWVKDCFGRLSSYSKENENKADLNYALKVLNYCKEHNAELNVAIEKNDKTERILDRWISSLYRSCKKIAESREENNEYWLKTSEKDFAYYNGVVNLLLENGINSVSKTNDYGEEYSAMLQELGLSDRINVVGEM